MYVYEINTLFLFCLCTSLLQLLSKLTNFHKIYYAY